MKTANQIHSIVTQEDVISAYLRFLGRMPELQSVIDDKLCCNTLDELEKQFINSEEYKNILKNYDIYSAENLQHFIDAIDKLGGWGAPATKLVVDRFRFHRDIINENLDPFSDHYVQAQLDFYQTLTGHLPNQEKTEMTPFNIEDHISAANPYAHQQAHLSAMHSSRISLGIKQVGLEQNARVLDLGCGWGFSSELMAFFGLQVLSVDINENFCELVNRRAKLKQIPVIAKQGSFEEIPTKDLFDAVVYYECLHHAIKPWVALERSYEKLKDGGKLLLAGEPINSIWWKNWGLRLDAEFLYVIKKFGWFKSGWTIKFLEECILRAGYKSVEKTYFDEPIGWIITATK